MKRIIKGDAPDFWVSFVKKHPNVMYNALDGTKDGPKVRNQLRAHLIQEQGNVCSYCCSILSPEKCHNEHIKPEYKYHDLTMDYNNIIVSCTQELHSDNSSCGMEKGKQYDARLFVSPLEDDCSKHFTFYPNGLIDSCTERGTYTLDLLRLHESKSLKASRKQQYEAVYFYCVGEVMDLCKNISNECGEDYASAKELYQLFFDEEVVPQYFLKTGQQLPAYIDMLEHFKEEGRFDFDSLVLDLISLGRLQFDTD